MTPLETVARALVQKRNKNLPVTDAPIDWEYISRNPENEWYRFYMGQARAALLVLGRQEECPDLVPKVHWDAFRAVCCFIATEGKDNG